MTHRFRSPQQPPTSSDGTPATEEVSFADMVPTVKALSFKAKAHQKPNPYHHRKVYPPITDTIHEEEPTTMIPDIDYETQIPATSYYKSGLQPKQLLRTFRKQRQAVELYADFHGMDRYEAYAYFQEIMHAVRHQHLRYIALIHGKGTQSAKKFSVIRIYLHRWLQEESTLLAYFPAQPREGGEGVTHAVFKRKNDEYE